MPRVERRYVEVYVFRRRAGRVQFLCLRRSAGHRLAGVWQPVTGKAEPGERSLDAAAREVLEETGLRPSRWWALETATVFYDAERDSARLLPLFAAEASPRARVMLSEEHDAFRWLGARAFGARVLWETQRRGLEAVRREVLSSARLSKALEVTDRLRAAGKATPERKG